MAYCSVLSISNAYVNVLEGGGAGDGKGGGGCGRD